LTQAGVSARQDPVGLFAAPSRRRLWTPANIVIAISSGLIAIIFAIFAGLCVQGFSTVLDQARSKTQSAADIVAEESQSTLGGVRALLQHLAADAVTPAGATALDASTVAASIKSLSAVLSFGLYDATGETIGGMASPNLPPRIGDLEFFKTLTSGGTDWTISKQMADAANGRPIFVAAQALPGSSFAGVALLVVSGDVMKDFWGPLQLGPESTTGLLAADGWVVARYPALPASVDSSQAPPFTTFKASERGTYISDRSPADGVARVVGFRRLPQLGVVVVASISQEAVFGPIWTSIVTVLWLLGPIAIALLIGSLATAAILRRSARTQASLTAAVEHNQVLFREIHHRVKNNLQSVASLLQMQPIDKEVKAHMGQRIAAMSAVHEHIYRSNDFTNVRVKSYLETLIENIRASGDPRINVVEKLEDLAVDKDTATPLGLILNEVLSNAYKHAFPEGRFGIITVTLTKAGDDLGKLTIEDNGVGFDTSKPVKGIGQRLVRALTAQLAGESISTSNVGGGSTFTLTFPLAK
jgi:two-component sensor histidine kinase